MLEKLLSLLLHAKGGAVATVLVLGASGALVTATVDNGMTTITITQPSQSQDGSPATAPNGSTTTTNVTVDKAILALFTRTKAEDDPTAPATGNGCSDAAHARNEQMKRVNDHAKTVRDTVKELGKAAPRTDAARKLVKDADEAIKDIRQAAVKAIHATFDCDKDDDEADVDAEDEDKDDEDKDDEDGPSVAFSGDDAKMIADLAIAAMDFQVTNLKTMLAALPTTPTANTREDKKKSDSDKDKHDNKGKRDNDKRGHAERDRHDNDRDDEDDD